MSRVRGPSTGGRNLRGLNRRLLDIDQDKGRRVAIRVAMRAATEITRLAGAAFDAGLNVYLDRRRLGVQGNTLSLVKRDGAARASLVFTNDGGTRIRAALAARYVKYLIGKYKILPIGNAAMPDHWLAALAEIVRDEGRRYVLGGGG